MKDKIRLCRIDLGREGGSKTFTVLQTADGKNTRRRRGGRPELARVPVPGGTFFYVLRAPRRFDPQTLLRLAARCAPEVLTALPLPQNAAARAFVPRVFPMRRALAALCAVLPQTRVPPQTLCIGVFDPDGALCGWTDALLPLALDVRIVTHTPQRFVADVFRARRQFGAPLTVGEDAALLSRCDVIVCRSPEPVLPRVPVVLSCTGADGAFSLLPVCLPDVYARLCPPCVTHDLFAAALAEKCGVRAKELYSCTGLLYGGERLCPERAAALWRERIGKI